MTQGSPSRRKARDDQQHLRGHRPVVSAYAAAYMSDGDDMAEGAEVGGITHPRRTMCAIACIDVEY